MFGWQSVDSFGWEFSGFDRYAGGVGLTVVSDFEGFGVFIETSEAKNKITVFGGIDFFVINGDSGAGVGFRDDQGALYGGAFHVEEIVFGLYGGAGWPII